MPSYTILQLHALLFHSLTTVTGNAPPVADDMQYASTGGGSHGPIATATQEAELRHQIRRLSHHPSIVLWDGCNEVVVNPGTPSYVFATFVMTVVAQEDQSRVVWCACDPLTLPQIKLKRHLMKFNGSIQSKEFCYRKLMNWCCCDRPSSPAKGWVTGVNRLYQTPNGEALTAPGGGHIWAQGQESHAPYQLGSGWPTVNGGVRDGCFNDAGTG